MKQQYTIDESLVEPRWTELGLARLLSDGALVPDTTLQDIANEWEMSWQKEIRELSPGLAALLDALEGADK